MRASACVTLPTKRASRNLASSASRRRSIWRLEAATMPSSRLLDLAHAVLEKRGTATWDTRGTVAGQVSQEVKVRGTAEVELNHGLNLTVPLSQLLGRGT